MPSRKPQPDLLSLANEIDDLGRSQAFDPRTARRVASLARRYPRSPQILLSATEYTELRHLSLTPARFKYPVRIEHRYREILNLDPRYARAWENLAAILDIERRFIEAEAAARKAVRHGDDPDALALLARILAQQGKHAQARRLARRPRVVNAPSDWARRTAAEVRAGDWRPSDDDQRRRERRLRRALARDPRNDRAWERLAAFLFGEDRLDEAAAAARKAVRHGQRADSILRLATILAHQNQRAEALALASDPRVLRSSTNREIAEKIRKGLCFPRRAKPKR